jgi:large repetitive protein
VRAKDEDGNVDGSPASYGWTVLPDTIAPDTTIGSAPAATVQSSVASFGFSANEQGATFECSLDGAAYTACTSPKEYTFLATGAHSFRVRAIDGAGNVDASPASHFWTIQAASCAATRTAAADRDTWVLQSAPSSNFGNDSVLKVDTKSGGNARALVRFALPAIPAGCNVTSATLRLYSGSYKEGRTLQAFRLGAAWNELSVNWSTQPATAGTAVTAPSRNSAGYVEWAVTSHVQAMYSGTNAGFLIRDASENGGGLEQSFNSREKGTDNPPQLVIGFG